MVTGTALLLLGLLLVILLNFIVSVWLLARMYKYKSEIRVLTDRLAGLEHDMDSLHSWLRPHTSFEINPNAKSDCENEG